MLSVCPWGPAWLPTGFSAGGEGGARVRSSRKAKTMQEGDETGLLPQGPQSPFPNEWKVSVSFNLRERKLKYL